MPLSSNTMREVLPFILLSGVVGAVVFPKVQSSAKVNAEIENINRLSSTIKNLYGKDFEPLQVDGNKKILEKNGFQKEMVVDANKGIINNYFGGTVEITSEYLNGTSSYKIAYSGVPMKECVKLTTDVGQKFIQVKVGDEIISDTPNSEIATRKATDACSKNDVNTIALSGN